MVGGEKMKKRNVGAYAIVVLGLVLAMGFAPAENAMAAGTGSASTDVMDDVLMESYDGALFIVISGVDLGDFDGIAALVMDNIGVDDLVSIMEYLGLDAYIPYVMEEVLMESLPSTVVLVLEDENISDMDASTSVPLFVAEMSLGDQGIEITPLVMEEITIESIGDIVPSVMEEITIE